VRVLGSATLTEPKCARKSDTNLLPQPLPWYECKSQSVVRWRAEGLPFAESGPRRMRSRDAGEFEMKHADAEDEG
jgi:hypothetical protein